MFILPLLCKDICLLRPFSVEKTSYLTKFNSMCRDTHSNTFCYIRSNQKCPCVEFVNWAVFTSEIFEVIKYFRVKSCTDQIFLTDFFLRMLGYEFASQFNKVKRFHKFSWSPFNCVKTFDYLKYWTTKRLNERLKLDIIPFSPGSVKKMHVLLTCTCNTLTAIHFTVDLRGSGKPPGGIPM